MFNQLETLIWIIIKIVCILVPLLIAVAYMTMAERKVISYMQGRIGPNRVGPFGLLQPIADSLKLLFKEVIIPTKSNHYLFVIAPMLAIMPALAAWAVVPFMKGWVLADINAGILYLFAMTSLGVYGILVAGWASNSKYALFGALRSAAQVVSYEIALGFSLVGVILASGTMNLSDLVLKQSGGLWHWYWLPLFPLFIVYWISSVAETNRAPFDVAEGEAEIVAGHMVEYSGMSYAMFYLAEYANMWLVSILAATMFLGGWLSPIDSALFNWVPGLILLGF